MNVNDKEHFDLMKQFGKDMGLNECYLRQEPKKLWPLGVVYAHGETNKLFLAYRLGYSFGKSVGQE